MKQRYCLGFLFSEDLSRVVLIRKVKPDWQSGKLNGVGGKIEPHELGARGHRDAMCREFQEETSVFISFVRWNPFVEIEFDEATIYCFSSCGPEIADVQTTTEEEVKVLTVERDSRSADPWWKAYSHMPNLEWLIPMARQSAEYLHNQYRIFAARRT